MRKGEIGLVHSQTDVFEVSSQVPRLGWRTARWLYRHGSSGGLTGRFYKWLRAGNNQTHLSLLSRLMGRDIRRRFLTESDPLLVAHPSLVSMLRDRPGLIYQHGEVVVPRSALVSGAGLVLVPTEQARQAFLAAGYDPDSVMATGLCIEPALVVQAEDAFTARLERLESSESLTGAFYSSGAEPTPHIEKLVAAALSLVKNGQRSLIFARRGGKLDRSLQAAFESDSIDLVKADAGTRISADLPRAMLLRYASRKEESLLTARLFSRFDFLVAPSHERTNWALGLGLPMFCPGPTIGPFARRNLEFLLDSRVARQLEDISEADQFGSFAISLRDDGTLSRWAQSGWGKYDIVGFDNIASYLVSRYAGGEG